ncbi:unnamed protein product [Diamesa serratosioi]
MDDDKKDIAESSASCSAKKKENKQIDVVDSTQVIMEMDEPMAICSSSCANNDNEPKKKFAKRNYRRRDQSQSSDSSEDDKEPEVVGSNTTEPIAPDSPTENSPPSSNHSGDVSLDDLILNNVINSDNDNQDDDSDSTESDFSFDSHLSLLHIMSNRRVFDHSSDSDSSVNENVIEDSQRKTSELLNKDKPLHNSTTWPRAIMLREHGYFCKNPMNTRFENHRKVFERQFHGSLNAVERLELMRKLDLHYSCVNSLSFSRNGNYLLSGSDDLRIIVWDWKTGAHKSDHRTKHTKNIFQTKFIEESSTHLKVVSASADGGVHMTTLSSSGSSSEKQLYSHSGSVHKIAVTDNVLYSCGEDGMIAEWDLRSRILTRLCTVREKHRKIPLFSISAHPLKPHYAVSGRDQFVRVYDRRNHKVIYSKFCPQPLVEKNTTVRYISCCVYNYNGSELLASFNDENIYLFDTNNHCVGSYLHKYEGHVNSATIKGVNFFGPKSEYIISGSDCSNIFFWDKETETIVQWMRGDENGIVNVLEPHPNLPVLATSGLDKDIKIWMPSNEDFKINKRDLEMCMFNNIKSQIEASSSATFTIDPAFISLAQRYISRQRNTTEVAPRNLFQSSSDDSSS